MALQTISGEIRSQPLNDNFASLNGDIVANKVSIDQIKIDLDKSKTNAILAKAMNDIGAIPRNGLSRTKTALATNTLKVALSGDSISCLPDFYNGQQLSYLPNLQDDQESYVRMLEDAFKAKLSGVSFTFGKFGLGGRTLWQFLDPNYKATNPETNPSTNFWRSWATAGKSWLNHVKDFAPDMIIVAFGMNDASVPKTDVVFAASLQTLYDTVQTWTPVPDIVLVPTVLQTQVPEKAAAVGQALDKGGYIHNALARATREFAKNKGLVCADANRIYNILRNGADEGTYVLTKAELNFDNYGTLWSGDKQYFNVSNGVLTSSGFGPTAGKTLIWNIEFLNGSVEFDFLPTANQYDGAVTVRLRQGIDDKIPFGLLQVYVLPNATDGYIQIADEEGPLFSQGGIAIPLNQTHRVKIEIHGSLIRAYVNRALAATYVSYGKMTEGVMGLSFGSVVPTISNFKVNALNRATGRQIYTDDELQGPVNQPYASGGGYNHPSGLTHNLCLFGGFHGVLQELK